MKKDFISVLDFSSDELKDLIKLAAKMKKNPKDYRKALKGKTLGLIFEKHSTRTRVSFETGIYQLGGIGFFYGPGQLQLDRGEPISDTAQVLSRYLDGIMMRTHEHSKVTEMAKYASIPIINGLTDFNHPCQVMADALTIKEKFGKLEGLKFAYVGDGNNMAYSLLAMSVKMGMHCSIVSPKDYTLSKDSLTEIFKVAKENNVKVTLTDNIEEGVAGADVVYTDVWTSMGQEAEMQKRLEAFKGFCIDDKVMSYAKDTAIFMHCLPAHRGEEVMASVIDGKQSVIFDEAENRLHAQKAILYTLMK